MNCSHCIIYAIFFAVSKIGFNALCHFLLSFSFSFCANALCFGVCGRWIVHTHAPHTCAFGQLFIIYNQRIPVFFALAGTGKKCPSDSGNNTTINILNLLRPHSTELMAVSYMLSLYFIYIYWLGWCCCYCFFFLSSRWHCITLLKVSGPNSFNTHSTHSRFAHTQCMCVLFWIHKKKCVLHSAVTVKAFRRCISMSVIIITCIYMCFWSMQSPFARKYSYAWMQQMHTAHSTSVSQMDCARSIHPSTHFHSRCNVTSS